MPSPRHPRTLVRACCAIVVIAAVAPAAFSQTPGSPIRSTVLEVVGDLCLNTDCTRVASLRIEEFTVRDGTRTGAVSVVVTAEPSIEWLIQCSGASYLNLVQVNRKQLSASVSAILNPSGIGCRSFNVAGPVAINLVAQYTGEFAVSETGSRTSTFGGTTTRESFAGDAWQVLLNGSIGSIGVAMPGFVSTQRTNEVPPRTK